MPVITARGADSAAAMDEVLRRLGADAFILSTRSRDGLVEIRAADHPLAADPADAAADAAPPETPVRRFADVLQARSDWAQPAKPRPAVPPRADSWPVDLRARRETAALDRLARDFLEPPPETDRLLPRTIIVGAAGAGKSMLAARLAAQAILSDRDIKPRIIAPRIATLLSDDRLRGWARLIGIVPERPLIGDLMQGDARSAEPPDPACPQIIDLSDVPDVTPDLAASLAQGLAAEIVLAMPTGLSPRRAETAAAGWAKAGAGLCFTFCDLAPAELPQMEALAATGLRLSRFAAGRGLVEQLHRPSRDDLARWLQEAGQDHDARIPEATR